MPAATSDVHFPPPAPAGSSAHSTAQKSDGQLVRRWVAEGDRSALEAFIALHLSFVHRLAVQAVGNAADADDVTQSVFLASIAALSRFRADADPRAWLAVITMNACRDRLRAGIRRRRAYQRALLAEPVLTQAEDPIDAEVSISLRAAVHALPEAERVLIALRFWNGLRLAEVAEVLAIHPKAVESRLRRALQRLRRQLSPAALAGLTLNPTTKSGSAAEELAGRHRPGVGTAAAHPALIGSILRAIPVRGQATPWWCCLQGPRRVILGSALLAGLVLVLLTLNVHSGADSDAGIRSAQPDTIAGQLGATPPVTPRAAPAGLAPVLGPEDSCLVVEHLIELAPPVVRALHLTLYPGPQVVPLSTLIGVLDAQNFINSSSGTRARQVGMVMGYHLLESVTAAPPVPDWRQRPEAWQVAAVACTADWNASQCVDFTQGRGFGLFLAPGLDPGTLYAPGAKILPATQALVLHASNRERNGLVSFFVWRAEFPSVSTLPANLPAASAVQGLPMPTAAN